VNPSQGRLSGYSGNFLTENLRAVCIYGSWHEKPQVVCISKKGRFLECVHIWRFAVTLLSGGKVFFPLETANYKLYAINRLGTANYKLYAINRCDSPNSPSVEVWGGIPKEVKFYPK
jgi:hypothetical protein